MTIHTNRQGLRRVSRCVAVLAMLGAWAGAQNPVPNSDFEGGATGWTLVSFNDPLGTTGVRVADTNGTTDTSQALFADFQTLSGVMSATYDSTTFPLKQGTYPITADVSWEKQVTTPIPSASVNRVEFRVIDSGTNTTIFNQRITVPNQTGLIERAVFKNLVSVPSDGTYFLQIFMRHSNLAGIPFITNIDDVAIGEYGATCSAGGSAANGNTLTYSLDAPSAASRQYFVGTSLGTGPIPIGARAIDLSLDSLLLASTGGALPSIFSSYAGTMSASGTATASLNIPALPALMGVNVNTAFVALAPSAPNGVLTISNTNRTELQ